MTGSRSRLTLSRALSQPALTSAWKGTIRPGLRNQELPDLHDHLDTHWRLPALVGRLHQEAIDFRYRPREAEIARLEKSRGITRRTVVPSAADAIVLQTLVESIAPSVLRAQPTRTAFYARSHQPRTMQDVDDSFPSDWLSLWKEGQRRIWEFSQAYDVIVVTDIANYFDAIPLSQLRNRIASMGQFSGAVLDLLFDLVESLGWRPEYLPRSGTGLPQIQFDAPRLLAHAYLYEADRYLRRATRGDVVRWMDDITFGVDNVETAKRILRDLDEHLASLGVRLNTGKTKILQAKEGVHYFRMLENRYLTVVENGLALRPDNPGTVTRARSYLRGFTATFWHRDRFGYWEKIAKRLFTLFGRLGDTHLQRRVPALLENNSALRGSIFRYYRRLDYSRARFRQVMAFLQGPHCLDDAGLVGAAALLVDWELPRSGKSVSEALDLARTLPARQTTSAAHLAAALMLAAKYGDSATVGQMVLRNTRNWRASEWGARQVAAVTVRMLARDRNEVARTMAAFGLQEGSSVIAHLQDISATSQLTRAQRAYLEHASTPFPLAKVLVSMAYIRDSPDRQEAEQFRSKVLRIVTDPTYRRLLSA